MGLPPRPLISTRPATPGQLLACSRPSPPWPTRRSPSRPRPSSRPPPPLTTHPATARGRTSPPPRWSPPPSPAMGSCPAWCRTPSRGRTLGCRAPPPPPPRRCSPPTRGHTPGPPPPGSASNPGSASSSCCQTPTRPGRRSRSLAGRTRSHSKLTRGIPTDTLQMVSLL